jgi:N-methylhydantoinase B
VMELPGGAGFGNPAERDPEHIARDVRNGVVAPESARTDYRVILRTDGSLDSEATVSLRNS